MGKFVDDSFKDGSKWITIQPNDVGIPYKFIFTVCSSATANDGSLPYGDSVASCIAKVEHEDGGIVTSEMIYSTQTSGNAVTVALSYPTKGGKGIYHLTLIVTTTNGSTIEFDYNRIEAKDL